LNCTLIKWYGFVKDILLWVCMGDNEISGNALWAMQGRVDEEYSGLDDSG
jgi:hypothetical protein